MSSQVDTPTTNSSYLNKALMDDDIDFQALLEEPSVDILPRSQMRLEEDTQEKDTQENGKETGSLKSTSISMSVEQYDNQLVQITKGHLLTHLRPNIQSFESVGNLTKQCQLQKFMKWLRSVSLCGDHNFGCAYPGLENSSTWSIERILKFLRTNPGLWQTYIRTEEWDTEQCLVCLRPQCRRHTIGNTQS